MDIYPPPAEIASALQDPGKKVPQRYKGKQIVKHKFSLIEKLATKLYNGILHHFGNHGVVAKNNTKNILLYTESGFFLLVCIYYYILAGM